MERDPFLEDLWQHKADHEQGIETNKKAELFYQLETDARLHLKI